MGGYAQCVRVATDGAAQVPDPLGAAGVQVVKHLGAHVTRVCGAANVELCGPATST